MLNKQYSEILSNFKEVLNELESYMILSLLSGKKFIYFLKPYEHNSYEFKYYVKEVPDSKPIKATNLFQVIFYLDRNEINFKISIPIFSGLDPKKLFLELKNLELSWEKTKIGIFHTYNICVRKDNFDKFKHLLNLFEQYIL